MSCWFQLKVTHCFDPCTSPSKLSVLNVFSGVFLVELIQTEVRHVQTLHIMERVFRQGMLDELQLSPSVLHALFPCLDQLTRIHVHFLDQLLLRRNNSLQPGSGHNFTIHQLGDILLEQVTCTQIAAETGHKKGWNPGPGWDQVTAAHRQIT